MNTFVAVPKYVVPVGGLRIHRQCHVLDEYMIHDLLWYGYEDVPDDQLESLQVDPVHEANNAVFRKHFPFMC